MQATTRVPFSFTTSVHKPEEYIPTDIKNVNKLPEDCSSSLKQTALKVACIAGIILLSPLIIAAAPFILGIVAVDKISEAYKCKFSKDSIIPGIKNLKHAEEHAKLEALLKIGKQKPTQQSKVTSNDIFINNSFESIINLMASKGITLDKTKANQLYLKISVLVKYKSVSRAIGKNLDKIVNTLDIKTHNKIEITKNIEDILIEKNKQIHYFENNIEELMKDFRKKWNNFTDALDYYQYMNQKEMSTDQYQEANQNIIKAYREVLATEAYQMLKSDYSNSHIQFLHKFASSIWNDVKLMGEFEKLGTTIQKKMNVPVVDPSQEEVSIALKNSIETTGKEAHQIRKPLSAFLWTLTHPKQVLGALAGGTKIASAFANLLGETEYDPHGGLGNNPSLQGTSTLSIQGKQATINNVYGASPTVGPGDAPKISLEFEAILQAATNNQIAVMLGTDYFRLTGVSDTIFYANFQNIQSPKSGEGHRSVEIMKLNEKYPLSFLGITLSKDSKFYGKKMRKEDAVWPGVQQFGELMKEKLKLDASFSLENRSKDETSDCGFYFPAPKEQWKPIFDEIIAKANEVFGNEQYPMIGPEAKELCGAYQECVYYMIQHYLEIKLANDLMKRGVEKPVVHSQGACKEDIDRGGTSQAGNLWLNMKYNNDTTDAVPMLIGSLNGRPLSSKDRLIIDYRTDQVLSFIKHVNRDEFFDKLHELLRVRENVDVTHTSFSPAVANAPAA